MKGERSATPPTRVRLATYNVHRCLGSDRRHDPERVARVIGEIGADVIALQEVSSRPREHGIDQLAYLAERSGLEAVRGTTLRSPRGEYGNGVLTRLPVRRVERVDLTVAGREPRGALDLVLDARGVPLRVLATHLGLSRRERRIQIRRLLDLVDGDRGPALVLLGDMNEWLPGRGGTLAELDRRLGPAGAARSYPARRPLLPLDRIWADPRVRLAGPIAHRSALARRASDHLPVCGELLLSPPGRTRAVGEEDANVYAGPAPGRSAACPSRERRSRIPPIRV